MFAPNLATVWLCSCLTTFRLPRGSEWGVGAVRIAGGQGVAGQGPPGLYPRPMAVHPPGRSGFPPPPTPRPSMITQSNTMASLTICSVVFSIRLSS